MNLRVLAVDDEPPALDELAYLLREHPLTASVTCAADATEALRLLHVEDFDAVFLDIHMPGLNGMELARLLLRFTRQPAIVFVTAFDDHAVEAFEVKAVDYLLKPIRKDRLHDALVTIDNARTRTASEATVPPEQRSSALAAAAPAADPVVPVEVGSRTVLIKRSSIAFVEASGDYVRLHTDSGSFLLRASLSALEEDWGDAGFVRIHRRYLVDLNRVSELRNDAEGGYHIKIGDRELVVSRRHTRDVKDRFTRTRGRPGRES
jgi:DNA-binding LytR/AlgR family response regulator